MSHQQCTRLVVNVVILMNDIECAPHRVAHETGGDGVSRHAIHEQETAGIATGAIRIHRDRAIRGDLHTTDVVHLQDASRMLVARDDIHAVAHIGDRGWHRSRS